MSDPQLNYVEIVLCDLCLDGAGGECHVPGCALWMSRAPDIPIRDRTQDVAPLPVRTAEARLALDASSGEDTTT